MYDIKPAVLQALNTVPGVTVSDTYPADWSKLPHISFYEIGNHGHLALRANPLSEISIQIDIWCKGSTGALAALVDEKMRGLGLRRQFAADVPDPSGVKHKTMRYRGIVDARNNLVYQ